jgi:hypothetical protein
MVAIATMSLPYPAGLSLFLRQTVRKSEILRWCFGGNTYTRNLDRMAAEGMKFIQAFVSSAVCAPSGYIVNLGIFWVKIKWTLAIT